MANQINVYLYSGQNYFKQAKNAVYGPGSFLSGADYKELQELTAKYYPNGLGTETIPMPAKAALL